MATITGTFNSLVSGSLSGVIGTPGPQGSQGATGATGATGPGVAVGGTTGMVLQKLSATNYDTGWATPSANFITAVTAPLAVTSGNLSVNLSAYLPLTGGAMDANATITFEDTVVDKVSEIGGYGMAVSSASNINLASNVLFDRVFVKNATSQTTLKPTGVEFPDLTLQTTAGLSPATASATYQTLAGMSSYLTTSAAASTYYLQTNPAGFITSAALSPYLLSSTAASTYAVIAAGQPVSGTVGQVLTKQSGTAYDSAWQTLIPGDRYLTTSTTSNTVSNGVKTFAVGTGLSYTTQQDVTIAYNASHHMHALVTSYNSGTGVLIVDVQQHTGTGTYASWSVNVGGVTPLASVAWGDITGTLGSQSDLATALNNKLEVSTAASTYLALAGGAMTGSITSAGTTYDTEMAGDLFGVQLSADHSKGSVLQFNGLDTYDGASHMFVNPTGLTFPDATTQTTAGLSPATAASTYYLQTNPDGFIGDAPSDGSQYARQDGAWEVVSGGGGVPEAPIDNYVYGRMNALWVRVPSVAPFLQIATGINSPLTGWSATGAEFYLSAAGNVVLDLPSSLTYLSCTGNAGAALNVSSCPALGTIIVNSFPTVGTFPGNLTSVTFDYCTFTSPPTLSSPSNITTYTLANSSITTAPSFNTFYNIATCNVYNNASMATTPTFDSNSLLTSVGLQNNTSMTSAPYFANAPLTYLNMSGCTSMTTYPTFAGAVDLSYVNVGNCAISNCDSFGNFVYSCALTYNRNGGFFDLSGGTNQAFDSTALPYWLTELTGTYGWTVVYNSY